MAIKTTLEQIEELDEAITNTLAAQEMGSGNDKVRRANLDTLYAQRDKLVARYNQENSSGPAINTGLIRRD